MEKETMQNLQQHREDTAENGAALRSRLRLQSWQGRALWLRLRSRLWILPLLAVLGALLAGGIYYLVTCVFADAREYQEVSKLYIDFAYDETGTVYDYYNGATWTDLLTAEPRLSDAIAEAIPDISMEEVKNSVKAEILSDIRLMTVTVTNADRERTERIAKAVNEALQSFGEQAKEFEKITFLSAEGPTLELVSDRTRNAVLLGTVLGLILGAILLWIRVLTGTGIYAPEEAADRFDLPVLGVLTKDEKENGEKNASGKVPGRKNGEEEQNWKQDRRDKKKSPYNPWNTEVLAANLQGRGVTGGQILLVCVTKEQEAAQQAAAAVQAALEILPEEAENPGEKTETKAETRTEAGIEAKTEKAEARTEAEIEIKTEEAEVKPKEKAREKAQIQTIRLGSDAAGKETGAAAEFALCRQADHIVLVMPWGKDCGVRTSWVLQQLNTQRVMPAGILLTQASGRFLQEYYRIREDEKA